MIHYVPWAIPILDPPRRLGPNQTIDFHYGHVLMDGRDLILLSFVSKFPCRTPWTAALWKACSDGLNCPSQTPKSNFFLHCRSYKIYGHSHHPLFHYVEPSSHGPTRECHVLNSYLWIHLPRVTISLFLVTATCPLPIRWCHIKALSTAMCRPGDLPHVSSWVVDLFNST